MGYPTNLVTDHTFTKYLFIFIKCGNSELILKLISLFGLNKSDDIISIENANSFLFFSLIAAYNNTAAKNFLNFFKIVVGTIIPFKQKYTKEEQVASFLSSIILLMLKERVIYEIHVKQIGKFIQVYKLEPNETSGTTVIAVQKHDIIQKNNSYIKILQTGKTIDTSQFFSFPMNTRKSDFKRYFEMYNNIHKLFGQNRVYKYCPVCNPYADKPTKEAQCCAVCKKFFGLTEKYLGHSARRRIYAALKKDTREKALERIHHAKFRIGKEKIEKEIIKNCNEDKTQNINSNLQIALKDMFWLANAGDDKK